MRTIPISEQFESASAKLGVAKGQPLPSGRAMLRSGVLGAQLIRLAELAVPGDADARVSARSAEEPAR